VVRPEWKLPGHDRRTTTVESARLRTRPILAMGGVNTANTCGSGRPRPRGSFDSPPSTPADLHPGGVLQKMQSKRSRRCSIPHDEMEQGKTAAPDASRSSSVKLQPPGHVPHLKAGVWRLPTFHTKFRRSASTTSHPAMPWLSYAARWIPRRGLGHRRVITTASTSYTNHYLTRRRWKPGEWICRRLLAFPPNCRFIYESTARFCAWFANPLPANRACWRGALTFRRAGSAQGCAWPNLAVVVSTTSTGGGAAQTNCAASCSRGRRALRPSASPTSPMRHARRWIAVPTPLSPPAR